MNEELVKLNHVSFSFGASPVLHDVCFSVAPNEVIGIRGENGAGKSTLMRIIAGVIRPDSGTCSFSEVLKNHICYVPQEIALYPTLTGKQNLDFWAEIYGMHGKYKRLRVRYLLKLMNLEDKTNKRVETYSGGMKRRLNMAASLVITPKLLLLDEPTVGTDTASAEIMHGFIRRMRNQGSSVVLISHLDSELYALCDRIVTMKDGAIVNESAVTGN